MDDDCYSSIFATLKLIFRKRLPPEEAGKVGLWTKTDAVTQFNDLRVKSLD